MKPNELISGAVVQVATANSGRQVEATVTFTAKAMCGHVEMTLIFTAEYHYPFAVDADREIELRNG